MAEAGSICLAGEGHPQNVVLLVRGDFEREFRLHRLEVDEQMQRSYRFASTATEKGACAVAVLLVGELTSYTVIEEAAKGSHIDYWLAPPDGFLFQGAARLEVSGLRRADEVSVHNRVRMKRRQIERGASPLPGYVVVVEFGRPLAWVLRR